MAELNGVPVTPDELKALALVNYGHFTSMRMDDQRIRGFSHHLERLVRDCRVLFGHELDLSRSGSTSDRPPPDVTARSSSA